MIVRKEIFVQGVDAMDWWISGSCRNASTRLGTQDFCAIMTISRIPQPNRVIQNDRN